MIKIYLIQERGILLRKWYNLLQDHSEDLAKIVTIEAGKPLAESLGEVAYGNSFVDWFAEEARRIHVSTTALEM